MLDVTFITKVILVIKWVAMAVHELFRPGVTFEDECLPNRSSYNHYT